MNWIFLASTQVTDSKPIHILSNIIGMSFAALAIIVAAVLFLIYAGRAFKYARRAFIWIRFKTTGKVPKDIAEEMYAEDPLHNEEPHEKK